MYLVLLLTKGHLSSVATTTMIHLTTHLTATSLNPANKSITSIHTVEKQVFNDHCYETICVFNDHLSWGHLSSMTTAMGWFVSSTTTAMGWFVSSMTTAMGWFVSSMTTAMGWFVSSMTTAMGWFVSSTTTAMGWFVSSTTTAMGWFVSSMTTAMGWFVSSTTTAMGWFVSSMTTAMGWFVSSMTKFFSRPCRCVQYVQIKSLKSRYILMVEHVEGRVSWHTGRFYCTWIYCYQCLLCGL